MLLKQVSVIDIGSAPTHSQLLIHSQILSQCITCLNDGQLHFKTVYIPLLCETFFFSLPRLMCKNKTVTIELHRKIHNLYAKMKKSLK